MTNIESAINIQILPDWAKEPSLSRYGDMEPPRERVENRGFKPRDDRREGTPRGRFNDRGDRKGGGGGRRPDRRDPRRDRPEQPVIKQVDVEVFFLPEPNALSAVIQQLRSAPRAYPVFSLSKMFLDKPDRQEVHLRIKDRKSSEDLYRCEICQFVTLSDSDAVAHVLKAHKNNFYTEEKTQVEPPKGNFTSVAQCKLNGKLLGPSNHHEYQANVMHLYKSEFSRMSFERFKESIVSIRDPEVVKKWQEAASNKSTFKVSEQPESPSISALEIERHYRANFHAKTISKGKEFTIQGEASRKLENNNLNSALRSAWEAENRFPQNLSRILRERFTKEGLQIFKGKKGMQFVSTVRPKPLVANPTDLSKGILDILDLIKANPNCTRTTLVEGLKAKSEVQGEATSSDAFQKIVLQDLHWLASQGHVIEYNNGMLELARPPKEKTEAVNSKDPQPKEQKSTEEPSPTSTSPAAETVNQEVAPQDPSANLTQSS